jgi:hypothetical protein
MRLMRAGRQQPDTNGTTTGDSAMDDQTRRLYATTDAQVWAQEFMTNFGQPPRRHRRGADDRLVRQRLRDRRHAQPEARAQRHPPTGRSIWLCHHHYDSPFGPDREAPETWGSVIASIGDQGGTFFKTSKVHNGMTVWLWGGRHPDDIPRIVARERAVRANYERLMASRG